MARVYTLNKELDEFVLDVAQTTVYELYYISDKSDSLIKTAVPVIDTPFALPAVKDGQYRLTLIVEGETNVDVEFTVIKYLQDSIINEAQSILCGVDNSSCNDNFTASCLSKAGKECLTHKGVFVKLLAFQTLYVPTYGSTYSIVFCNFLEEGAKTYNCKLQTSINTILMQECVTGNIQSVEKLFKLYLALYWAGMYFIEENLATGDEAQLTFIKEKFMYDCIVPCLCGLCIDIDTLKEAFTVDPNTSTITSYQFDGVEFGIADVALLTEQYLIDNGAVQTEEEMLAGKLIAFSNIGKLGFVLKNVNPGTYNIFDVFGNDITTTVFDVVYDVETFEETFVSKTHYVPSSVYFKFIKN